MSKFIKCPNCGHVFKSPAVDIKTFGFGFTFPGLGVIRCPDCKEEKRRKYFPVATDGEIAEPPKTRGTGHVVRETPIKDLIEDSRYEDD